MGRCHECSRVTERLINKKIRAVRAVQSNDRPFACLARWKLDILPNHVSDATANKSVPLLRFQIFDCANKGGQSIHRKLGTLNTFCLCSESLW